MAYRALSEISIYQTGWLAEGMLVCVFALFKLFSPFFGNPSSHVLITCSSPHPRQGRDHSRKERRRKWWRWLPQNSESTSFSRSADLPHQTSCKHGINVKTEDEQTLRNILQKVLTNMEWTWQWALIAKKTEWFILKIWAAPNPHSPSFPCGAKARNQVQCGNFEQPKWHCGGAPF